MPDNILENKVAIVTGAGGRIGSAVAQALGRACVRVAVNDINPDRAEAVAGRIRAAGGQALAITADVSNKFQCVNLVETTRQEWERLDILVNSAAVKPAATILKMDEWAWQRCIDVNLKGTFLMSQLVGRVMADENRERGGLIANLALAPSAEPAAADQAAYHAARVGISGFTTACAREFAGFNVRVDAVFPARGETAEQVAARVMDLLLG